ncbi:MAG: Rrf2 family transcriptional regulator [Ignavibacteriales bacterium]|nr:Rrf2 family transcriptional regulator [Ignavibacteriales bacterium]
MQLTMTGEYALRAIVYICSKPNGSIFQISEISTSNGIPESFLRKIIPQLNKSGIIQSQRGIGGGISLRKPAELLTPLEIIESVEGKISLNKCLISSDFCSNDKWCSVHTLWSEAQNKLKEMLSGKTMAQLAEENKSRFKTINSH